MSEPARASRDQAAATPRPAPHARVRAVIFDFDGTLADSGNWFLSIVDDLSERFNFRKVDPQEVDGLRHKTTRQVIAHLGIPNWKLPFIARHVRRRLGRNTHEISLFPGTPGLLDALGKTDLRLALVTSNAEANARAILGPALSARFETMICGSSLYGKAPKFRRALKRLGVAPHEAISIGDETRDIDAAREVGMRAGAVLWGYAAEDALAALKPEIMFRTQDEIVRYVTAG